jgi:ribosome-associated protein
LEQLALLSGGKNRPSTAGKKTIKRLTKSSKIIKTIIAAIGEKKGQQIISLDLRKINEAVADFFIICEAGNAPQIRAITDNVINKVKNSCAEGPFHQEGQQQLQWVLIDYVNVVVHIMHPDSRRFYRLEEMWSDALLTEHDTTYEQER